MAPERASGLMRMKGTAVVIVLYCVEDPSRFVCAKELMLAKQRAIHVENLIVFTVIILFN
jgi:hypothetical protein